MNDDKGNPRALKTSCCIAGGGPAGMMLGLLLARMGVEVVVLEKHADFLRDFRGDTIHPPRSTSSTSSAFWRSSSGARTRRCANSPARSAPVPSSLEISGMCRRTASFCH